jgi:hypothetical protein
MGMSSQEGSEKTFVPSGIERDLENARVLLEDSPWCDSPQKYRKTAETIVLRILSFDPENSYAKKLLQKARVPVPVVTPVPAVTPVPEVTPVRNVPEMAQEAAPSFSPDPVPAPQPKPARVVEENLLFVAYRAKPTVHKERKSSGRAWTGIAAVLVIAGIVWFRAGSPKSQGHSAPKTAAAASVPVPVPVSTTEQAKPELPPALQQRLDTATATAAATAAAPADTVVVKSPPPVVAPIHTGTLAVSSPTTVDIYINDQLVGSAPTTLELTAGTQTVQYRHGDMRKVVSHLIKSNETTTAMITFDIPVQINAKPWAQVSIDGSQRQALGQTPLSDIKVPIGSVLLFENPNFPSKTYRVTGRESEIRVNFP